MKDRTQNSELAKKKGKTPMPTHKMILEILLMMSPNVSMVVVVGCCLFEHCIWLSLQKVDQLGSSFIVVHVVLNTSKWQSVGPSIEKRVRLAPCSGVMH